MAEELSVAGAAGQTSTSVPPKPRITTVSLAGCFGCHMSLLDIDERLAQLAEIVEFDRSPFTDIKEFGHCDIGLAEGGLCNEENVAVLKDLRAHCRILVAVGACAINGGIPALRNRFPLKDCLAEAYLDGIGLENPHIPIDPELPLLLDKVYPVQEVVRVDYYIPGCPAPAEALWQVLTALAAGREPNISPEVLRYD